jgi:energy-coupling factor transport system substrate-specific component
MTWTLATFTILFLALAGGFAWYERAHPSSKVLALVATLAALAALGRVAFAPLPNVKPTTDVVVLAGVALGAAPGFAVGAVAAVASNLIFGEGPWTPWQMLAWGACGLAGALLGRLTRRDPGRWTLAVTCGLAGVGFGAIMDLSTWTTFTGQRTLGEYLAISGVSLPFNVAHVVGNVVFALAFGPLFVRMLARFRARVDVTWRPAPPAIPAGAAVAVATLLGAAALAGGPGAGSAQAASVTSRALAFLGHAQNRDGGWGAAKGAGSTQLYTSWALLGQAAARHGRCDARGVRYLQRGARAQRAPGDVERTVLAVRACGRPAGSLRARLVRQRRGDGSFQGLTNLTAFGILALRAAGVPARDGGMRRSAAFVARQQNRDHGFSFARRGAASGTDETAAALEALVAAGRSRRRGAIPAAVRYLRAHQNPDGGFPLGTRGPSNAQSTAWAVQALVAAGVDPDRVRRGGSRSAMAYLRSLSAPDGSVRYSRTSRQTPVWVTAQALTALARAPFPIR